MHFYEKNSHKNFFYSNTLFFFFFQKIFVEKTCIIKYPNVYDVQISNDRFDVRYNKKAKE